MSHVVFQLKIFRTFQQKSPTQRSGLYHMWFSRSTFSIRFSKKVLLIDRGICHMWFSSSKFPGRLTWKVQPNGRGIWACGFPGWRLRWKVPLNGRVYVACGFPGLRFISTWSKCQQGSWSLFTTYMAGPNKNTNKNLGTKKTFKFGGTQPCLLQYLEESCLQQACLPTRSM